MTRGLRLIASGEHAFGPIARWRDPAVTPSDIADLDQHAAYAGWAEDTGFDALFYADFLGFDPVRQLSPRLPFDPVTLTAALVARTRHLGFITTSSTTFGTPFHVARSLASLDRLSGGRVAWNIVTSFTGEANFGLDGLPSPAHRYARAQEFLDVVDALWKSFPESAVIDDKTAGRYVDVGRIHAIDHVGEHFSVSGPLDKPGPVRRPVLVQAGSSPEGVAFAARNADVVFVAVPNLEEAIEFRTRLTDEVAAAGRAPDAVLIVPGFRAFLGADAADARRVRSTHVTPDLLDKARRAVLRESDRFEFVDLPLDEPIPASHLPTEAELDASAGRRSRALIYLRWAQEPGVTLREVLERIALEHGHFALTASPSAVADELEKWFLAGAADGFMVGYGSGIAQFADEVMPLLAERGLWKPPTDHHLRDRLGLPERV
ncbi:NtaA/DmoA family FMN-dependent monooxygenase [Mycobacterium sp. 236(2023)]|uniref:NtaA/DmoA family FMN-dependent monooxygenase n=1 Tax=Mycobacterium sp. 236(2023) TaxID=3038163 RepID=UPI0024154F50|nr:NtaA/DmoA family FMN-dependent monooxygenase [Mycobacterium sp. 236(2023)]MDG4663801.1 NtaA/DmoA family FMN-dependent monooxygenase [Mycobacterium sp. 236(2023)]